MKCKKIIKRRITEVMITESTGRILVIDDDRDYSDGMVAILKSHNHDVEQAFNVEQAIARLDDFDPEVVLLDLRLGRESGIDVLNEMKSRNHPAICILITAYSSIDSAVGALRAGAYDYLQKPISPETLMNNISHCFDRILMEKVIKKHHVELEDRVAERTAELLESKEMYKSLTKLLPVGVMRVDADKKCTFVNDRWTNLTGYKFKFGDEAYDWCVSLTDDTKDIFSVEWDDFLNNYSCDESCTRERKIIQDGIVKWVLFEAIKVDVGGCIITAVDITKQKEFLPELMLIKQGLRVND